MRKHLLTASLASLALMLAGPAMAQGQPAAEAAAVINPIPGVVATGAQWKRVWEGPMIVDGMTTDADGNILFAQEQSNSIIKVWPDGKWWVQWPFVAGAGSVSIDSQGRAFAADRSCTDPGLFNATNPAIGLGVACTQFSKIVQLTPERRVVADKFADVVAHLDRQAVHFAHDTVDVGGELVGVSRQPRGGHAVTEADSGFGLHGFSLPY